MHENSDETLVTEKRLDRTAFSVVALDDADTNDLFWHSQTVGARLAAMEWMRQVCYGYDPATRRLQRILTIAQLGDD